MKFRRTVLAIAVFLSASLAFGEVAMAGSTFWGSRQFSRNGGYVIGSTSANARTKRVTIAARLERGSNTCAATHMDWDVGSSRLERRHSDARVETVCRPGRGLSSRLHETDVDAVQIQGVQRFAVCASDAVWEQIVDADDCRFDNRLDRNEHNTDGLRIKFSARARYGYLRIHLMHPNGVIQVNTGGARHLD